MKALAKQTEIRRVQCIDAAENYVQMTLVEKHGYEAQYTYDQESNTQFTMEVAKITDDVHVAAIAVVMYAGLGERLYDVANTMAEFEEKFSVDGALENFHVEDFTMVTKVEKLEQDESHDSELDE